jgi:hypothetical protein
LGWLIFLLWLACFAGSFFTGVDPDFRRFESLTPILLVGGVVLLLFSAFWAIFAVRVVWPKKIDDRYSVLSGAGAEFLDSLPQAG